MTTTREKFLAIVEERYVCRAMPAGGFTTIATELGVSRERIRQLAKAEGIAPSHVSPLRKPKKACSECSAVLSRGNNGHLCHECKRKAAWLTINCGECGIEKSIYLPTYKSNLNSGKNAHGIPFCSGKCASTYWRREKPVWSNRVDAVSSTVSLPSETTHNPIKALFSLRWRR